MKKLINDTADVVTEALRGVELAHPDLRVDHELKIIYRRDAPVQGKVGIVSGGGSGHEPLQGGFVGPGGLDAACAGEDGPSSGQRQHPGSLLVGSDKADQV